MAQRTGSSRRPGTDRGDADYVWPPTLSRPSAPTRLVYLDLNHWIGLAKASVKHPDGARYRPLLEQMRTAPPEFVFPLSSVHFMEMQGNSDARQRADVASVMEEISGFRTMTSLVTVMELEFEASLAALEGTAPASPTIALLGRGVLHAFGRRGGLRVFSQQGEDVTQTTRAGWPGGPAAFDSWSRDADTQLARVVLAGPTEEDVPKMAASGWDPLAAKKIAQDRAAQHEDLRLKLNADPQLRRGRTRDLVSTRYLAQEALTTLTGAAARHPEAIRLISEDREVARRLTDSMPSADVHISLVTAAHRNAQTAWSSNSILDIDAMSLAAAYCDVVLTERHFARQLQATGVAMRTGTTVLTTPSQLDELLQRHNQ